MIIAFGWTATARNVQAEARLKPCFYVRHFTSVKIASKVFIPRLLLLKKTADDRQTSVLLPYWTKMQFDYGKCSPSSVMYSLGEWRWIWRSVSKTTAQQSALGHHPLLSITYALIDHITCPLPDSSRVSRTILVSLFSGFACFQILIGDCISPDSKVHSSAFSIVKMRLRFHFSRRLFCCFFGRFCLLPPLVFWPKPP